MARGFGYVPLIPIDGLKFRLEENKKIQVICVGPVVDIYGRFAASKLKRLMEIYPGRLCSIPEYTVLPPEVNAGADFALMPSRDEPFGLVAVEFGRQGALGIGSRLGGLALMPGWVSDRNCPPSSILLIVLSLSSGSGTLSSPTQRHICSHSSSERSSSL